MRRVTRWAGITKPVGPRTLRRDPAQRLTAALTGTYAWYERAEAMLTSVTRDAELLPGFVGGSYAALLERLRQPPGSTSGW